MKDWFVLVVLVLGAVLLAGGNDWGIVGVFPALWSQLKELKKDGAESPRF